MKGDARRPYVRKSRSASPHRSSSKSWLSRRLKRLKTRDTVILAGFLAAFLFGLVKTFFFWRAVRWEHMKPFRYVEYHQAELALPQHDLHNAFSNGKKYFWVNNHVSGLGWGNFLEDLIMNAQVAYSSGRSFVFDNHTWNRDNTEWSGYQSKYIPSQIPLSALISGPIIGGAFVQGDNTPLAVHKKFYDQICPRPTIVDTQDVIRRMADDRPSAKKILDYWAEYLRIIDDPCVEVGRHAERIFDYYIYGQKDRMLTIWPTLSESPILRLLGWSPLVHAAFDVNRALFAPVPPIEPYPVPTSLRILTDPYTTLPGLLVLHVRRNDFDEHCVHLSKWASSFNAFNSFPELPDQWTTPTGSGGGSATPEALQLYLRRCFPTIEQMVEKVEDVRRSPAGQGLKSVYVMTNGKKKWVQKLKKALMETGRWDRVASSRDLKLTKAQKHVAQAVDMLIGQRAQVLIGNGFSSLTSDIVMLRMARGLAADSNRFW